MKSLRGYPNTSAVTAARTMNTRSPRQSRDHFAEGQASMHDPRAKQGMNELKTYQTHQVNRLAMPKRNSIVNSFETLTDLKSSSSNLRADSTRGCFLRKTTQGGAFGGDLMQRSSSIGSGSPTHKTNMG